MDMMGKLVILNVVFAVGVNQKRVQKLLIQKLE